MVFLSSKIWIIIGHIMLFVKQTCFPPTISIGVWYIILNKMKAILNLLLTTQINYLKIEFLNITKIMYCPQFIHIHTYLLFIDYNTSMSLIYGTYVHSFHKALCIICIS